MYVLRSMLFTPGNNKRMIQKASTLGADAIILDLEDAVPISEKEAARRLVGQSITLIGATRRQVFVRVNALSTGLTAQDVNSVVQPQLAGIVLPKTQSGADVATVAQWIGELEDQQGMGRGSIAIVPLLETARGVLDAREVAAAVPRIVAVAFGALDFAQAMGIRLSTEGTEVLYARSRIALAASAAQVVAIDTPWIDIADREGLVQEARHARQLGFRGKLVIHPSQIAPVNEAFSPSEDEVAYAKKVVEAFRAAEADGLGAISLDGKMIDAANARQATDLIAWAEAISHVEHVSHPRSQAIVEHGARGTE
jgi:citrate lyase subunit beta/citryl-CoA lyase